MPTWQEEFVLAVEMVVLLFLAVLGFK